ncbi:Phosphoglycolate phosphatase [Maioricimonas rarisocia]|uniref:Phosphoglycolate phosphatase n=1 Tax=Maioricimonas rarisocia TaxID=2528026 RepID=A0A517ZF16_9PLAN|nr:HAD family hydrolase [Maioricimonas rarisocia]QDU41061.1 Phosphoglycolate phosphatase [Maioricimonas rarisocia]
MSDPLVELYRSRTSPLEAVPTEESPRTEPLDDIRAVLFDIYGTLVISGSGDVGTSGTESQPDAFLATLESVGLEHRIAGADGVAGFEQAIRDTHVEAKGAGIEFPEVEIREIWRLMLNRFEEAGQLSGSSDLTDEQIARLAIEYEVRTNPVWPMPGARDCLATLRERGLKLGIVSNAQFYTPLMLEAFFDAPPEQLGIEPDLCYWSYRHREAKPSRKLYELACDGLADMGISPAQVLYVGNDMLKDVWPAQAVGFRTALFAGDARSLRKREDDERIRGVDPDLVVTELTQIAESVAAGE